MIKSEVRDSYFDNIKATLIILVVIGHLLESFLNAKGFKFLYVLIYSFHMPLFIFCSGYFASKDNQKILKRIIIPYLVFQPLYLLLNKFVLNASTSFTYTTPYWILWYLFSLAIWNIVLQFIKKVTPTLILITFGIGILVGFDNSIGYYASLSRAVVFFPFFLLGYYCRNQQEDIKKIKSSKLLVTLTVFLSLLTIVILYSSIQNINVGWFYGSYSYSALDYSWVIRTGIYAAAILLSAMEIILAPKKKILLFTVIGERSMPIFLLHGLIVKVIQKAFPFSLLSSVILQVCYLVCFTGAIILLLSSPPVAKVFKKAFPKN